MKAIHWGVLLLATTVAPFAMAGRGRPGLWQTTLSTNVTQGAPAISPDQLEKMRQQGISLPSQKPATVQVCVTPEMAARDDFPQPMRPEDHCQIERNTQTASAIDAIFVCTGDTKGQGSVKVKYDSDIRYTGEMHFTGTSKLGRPIEFLSQFSGKWLAADCRSATPPLSPEK